MKARTKHFPVALHHFLYSIFKMGSIKFDDINEVDNHNIHVVNPLDPEEYRTQAHKVVDFIVHIITKTTNNSQFLAKLFLVISEKPSQKNMLQMLPNPWNPFSKMSPDLSFRVSLTGKILTFLLTSLLETAPPAGCSVVGFNWVSSPAATELEMLVIDWFGEMLKLPKSFLFSGGGGGVLHGTTCEAILCTLVAL